MDQYLRDEHPSNPAILGLGGPGGLDSAGAGTKVEALRQRDAAAHRCLAAPGPTDCLRKGGRQERQLELVIRFTMIYRFCSMHHVISVFSCFFPNSVS